MKNWFFYRNQSNLRMWGILISSRSVSVDIGRMAFGWEWSWTK